MNVKILFQYHNNMYDTVKALETKVSVQFLSYRISQVPDDIPNVQPHTTGQQLHRYCRTYIPTELWQLLSNTDVLILKHINDPINLIPYFICQGKGIKCIIMTQKMTHTTIPFYRPIFSLLMWYLRMANVIVMATTRDSYQYLKPYIPRTYYIPACINPERFKQTHTDPNREKTTKNDKTLNILTVSKYQPRKNIHLLIEAVAELQRKFQDTTFTLTVIGRLSQDPRRQALYRQLQDLVISKGLQHEVKLETNIPHADMPQHYQQADLFVLPAVSEPLGYTVLEAMASGLPILCSTDAGAASYIQEEKNGYLFNPQETQTLQQAMARFIATDGTVNRTRLKEYGAASKKIVNEHHVPEVFLKKVQKLFA